MEFFLAARVEKSIQAWAARVQAAKAVQTSVAMHSHRRARNKTTQQTHNADALDSPTDPTPQAFQTD